MLIFDRLPRYERLLERVAPSLLYERLYAGTPGSFLYESLEVDGERGRYSFLGGRPRATFEARGRRLSLEQDGERTESEGDPIEALRALVSACGPGLPVATFAGGAVGYFAYDTVRHLAPLVDRPDGDDPDARFVFPEEIIAVDHRDEVVHLIHYGEDASERLALIAEALRETPEHEAPIDPPGPAEEGIAPLEPAIAPERFREMVTRARDHIHRGDALQIVLSQRFDFAREAAPFDYYRAVRRTNPSPYMYFLDFGSTHVVGSSPEVLVRLKGRRAVIRPLAGTRPRGASPAEDEAIAEELLSDPKERAEHLMLIDLARNDLGRVSRPGTVQLEDSFFIERFSRVMHLTSQASGRLRPDRDAFDLFRASFPAGTVSGAPKVRAMQIIDELEPTPRGIYAGAIGYLSFQGDMDLCIAIRTLVLHPSGGQLQVGAGVVADSDPELEYRETLAKARGVLGAIRLAERLGAPG